MDVPNSFEHVLVGVDAEGLSSQAVKLGFQLVDELGSRLDLVHAVQIASPLLPGPTEKLEERHAEALSQSRIRMNESLRPVLAEAGHAEEPLDQILTLVPGHAARVLLEQSVELRSDLVVLGPHSKRKLLDFGGTLRAVFAHSTVPIWVQAGPPERVRTILVPVDFSDHSQVALDLARRVAQGLDARIQVLHVHAPPAREYTGFADAMPGPTAQACNEFKAAAEAELKALMDAYEWGQVGRESVLVEGDPTEAILEAASNAQLVVMGTHGRTGLARFLLGGTTYGVLRRSPGPVLVVPYPGRAWQLGETG